MSGSNTNTETRREASLEVDNISIGIDDVRSIISDFLSGTKDRCQSTVMGIFNRIDEDVESEYGSP